jgi:hypothetical protein
MITINVTPTIADFNAIPSRDAAIADWHNTKAALKALTELEREKRAVLYTNLFPGNVDTTATIDLGAPGYKLKATGSLNYKLQFSTKEDGRKALDEALDRISKTGNEGAFLVDRLVQWKPELSVGEYKKLDSDGEIKKIIDAVLTITPGSPTLEFVTPK